MGPPRPVTNKASVTLPAKIRARASSIYRTSQCPASAPNGTSRVLLPLPVIRKTPSGKLNSNIFNSTSSDTRKPLAYINSNIVLSRRPNAVFKSGAANNASTCASESVLGKRAGCFAPCNFKQGSASIFRCINAKR